MADDSGTPDDSATLVGTADDPGGDGGRLWGRRRTTFWRGRPDDSGGWQNELGTSGSGEDDAAIVTHHSDVSVGLPGPTLQRLFVLASRRRGRRSRAHKTCSSPASGGCGWVPRYDVQRQHTLGFARVGSRASGLAFEGVGFRALDLR